MRYKETLLIMLVAFVVMSCSEHDGIGATGEEPETDSVKGEAVNVEVLDYSPAPGQFVNIIPEYEDGDDAAAMREKAQQMLNSQYMISLGAWGGSVTLKLSQPIVNIDGKNDFRILGNAVYATSSVGGVRYGSAEPGIVYVMQDVNGNGTPDDGWCEIIGSETFNGDDNVSVTYHRPLPDATDEQYIAWETSAGDSGFINRNSAYHTQDYFPVWLGDVSDMTFTGRMLPANGYYNNETGRYDLVSYYGYADSHPNNSDYSCLDVSLAVDGQGNRVNLSAIDFVKICTGVLQSNGPLGECSTEVAGIEKLVY